MAYKALQKILIWKGKVLRLQQKYEEKVWRSTVLTTLQSFKSWFFASPLLFKTLHVVPQPPPEFAEKQENKSVWMYYNSNMARVISDVSKA